MSQKGGDGQGRLSPVARKAKDRSQGWRGSQFRGSDALWWPRELALEGGGTASPL